MKYPTYFATKDEKNPTYIDMKAIKPYKNTTNSARNSNKDMVKS